MCVALLSWFFDAWCACACEGQTTLKVTLNKSRIAPSWPACFAHCHHDSMHFWKFCAVVIAGIDVYCVCMGIRIRQRWQIIRTGLSALCIGGVMMWYDRVWCTKLRKGATAYDIVIDIGLWKRSWSVVHVHRVWFEIWSQDWEQSNHIKNRRVFDSMSKNLDDRCVSTDGHNARSMMATDMTDLKAWVRSGWCMWGRVLCAHVFRQRDPRWAFYYSGQRLSDLKAFVIDCKDETHPTDLDHRIVCMRMKFKPCEWVVNRLSVARVA